MSGFRGDHSIYGRPVKWRFKGSLKVVTYKLPRGLAEFCLTGSVCHESPMIGQAIRVRTLCLCASEESLIITPRAAKLFALK